MKIEKVNDNQIRCTLTKEDLADRQIRLSELAYGTEKAKTLFRDMIQQANYEFGFEANDIPLMVEAIPVSADSIILLITKVEYPEELDTRFSKFSEADDELFDSEEQNSDTVTASKGADDVLGMFRKLRGEQGKNQESSTKQKAYPDADNETKRTTVSTAPEVSADLTKMFEFHRIEEVERIAHVLDGYYHGVNDLYKNEQKNRYYLLIHKSGHTPEEFNKVCNIICEYALQKNYTNAVEAYFAEHGKVILKEEALQVLASLNS